MAGHPRPLRFVRLEGGCSVCLSHSPTGVGYVPLSGEAAWESGSEALHRLIYRMHYGDIPDGMEVDHKCRMRLCCEPTHLRLATRTQNNWNKAPHSGAYKKGKKWRARSTLNGKRVALGYYDTKEEAEAVVKEFVQRTREGFA